MTLRDQILEYLSAHPGATDTEMEKAFQVIHQQVNYACRMLERDGLIIRRKTDRFIGNFPAGSVPSAPASPTDTSTPSPEGKCTTGEPLDEESIKRILTEKLTAEGWIVSTAWSHAPGVDIDARRGSDRWLIEVKGPGSRPQMRVNYFLSMLGEILQRMDDPSARYSFTLPDLSQYRALWDRLPMLAKQRTGIDILFVDADGKVRM